MLRRLLGISALLLTLSLLACAPKAAPASTSAPAAQAQPSAAPPPAARALSKVTKEAWELKWDAMVDGAKKEGKVVIYSTLAAEIRTASQRAFKEKFGIDAEFVAGSSAAIGARAMVERRAGLRLADILAGAGTQVISQVKPAGFVLPIDVGEVLILPEFADPKLWLGGGFFWQDAEHTSLTYSRYEMRVLSRNTELVKEGEIQSYNDLLNPKWKGKILVADPVLGGGPLKALVMVGRYNMGWDWVRALVKQEPVIIKDLRLQAEWLARGKYPLAYGGKTGELQEFKNMGLPVDTVPLREGGYLGAGSCNISLMKDTLHPNAAKLFINWLLTKEGQTIISRIGGYPSVRLDVSDEGAMFPRAAPDSKAPSGDTEEVILQQNEDFKILKEILQPLLK